MPASIAMIAITTSNSIKVNPARDVETASALSVADFLVLQFNFMGLFTP